jgi:hypothetical protein
VRLHRRARRGLRRSAGASHGRAFDTLEGRPAARADESRAPARGRHNLAPRQRDSRHQPRRDHAADVQTLGACSPSCRRPTRTCVVGRRSRAAPAAPRLPARRRSSSTPFSTSTGPRRDAALPAPARRQGPSRSTAHDPARLRTMKLNATSEMIPITWPEFAHIIPTPGRPARRLRGASPPARGLALRDAGVRVGASSR